MTLPIVFSNATVPLLGAKGSAVIGHLGQAAPIGAVGLGAEDEVELSANFCAL